MTKKTTALFFILTALSFTCRAAVINDSTWADSVYRSLSREERIAQLFIIRSYSYKDSVYEDSLINQVKKYHPGGVCFFKGTPFRQASLTNRLQQLSQTPLLVATDAEWGLGMRLDSAFSFPRQMTLGAIPDDSLIYQVGLAVAAACRRIGVQINFAPVADINNNPLNPVIGFRSFGEDANAVAGKSVRFMQGMQDGGIMTTAKHFPGHGDTDADSHVTLPVINHPEARMDSVELLPFRQLIQAGVMGIMVGHLSVPCYDTIKNNAATLSHPIVTGLLRQKLGFRGLVITDALDMQGVIKHHKPGEIEVRAFLAGNDILLLPKHLDLAIKGISMAVDSGRIDSTLLRERCLRILRLKFSLGLNIKPVTDLNNLTKDLNPVSSEVLRRTIIKEAITLVKNEINIIPLTGLDSRRIALLSLGDTSINPFQEMAGRYGAVDCFSLPRKIPPAKGDSLLHLLSKYDILIIGLHGISSTADSFGLTRSTLRFVDTLSGGNRCILTLFGTPYALNLIPGLKKMEAIAVAYQDNPATEEIAAEVIFGGVPARGKLPVTAAAFKCSTGDLTDKTRVEFIQPEELGIPSAKLAGIDSIVMNGIRARAYPGCQVLFAKDGKVFYYKAFGHPRQEDTIAVTTRDMYDLASVTKVAATTLAVMKLWDEKKLSLDDSMGKYLSELKGSNKAKLTIRDVMTHQAGLQAWIPFFRKTLKNGQPDPALYQTVQSNEFPVRVAEFLYLRKDYEDTLFSAIIASPLRPDRDYKYSDLGFYMLRRLVEHIVHQPFEQYLDITFYKPLGLQTIGFTPRRRFDLQRLMPTEYDTVFRKQLIRGDVHDPGAAMLGGISGHAGLFSDAQDLAVILQMLLQNGEYGGKQYFSEQTVREFTRQQFAARGNRRAIGFDKPPAYFSPEGPVCRSASHQSFGHSGFTGTYLWADPANGLVFVFLSNRVCPDAGNQKLTEMNIRTALHQAMYDLLIKYRIK